MNEDPKTNTTVNLNDNPLFAPLPNEAGAPAHIASANPVEPTPPADAPTPPAPPVEPTPPAPGASVPPLVDDPRNDRSSREFEESRSLNDENSNIDEFFLDPTQGRLAAPPAREGFTQRWIATKIAGTDNSAKAYHSIASGWRPRTMASLPAEFKNAYITHEGKIAGFEDVIVAGDMILCEMPLERYAKRQAAIQRQVQQQNDASVDVSQDPALRIESETRSSISTGQRPDFQS